MKKFALLFLFACGLAYGTDAQEAPKVKFEKVSDEELAMKSYAADTTAGAVILYDEGSSYIKYETERGFMLTYERFVRIKILKQSGVEWGDFVVPLYSHNSNKEEMIRLKGTTINRENGKTIKTDLKKSAIFRDRENKYWESVRFSMPSVKVGSVIDVQYTIYSNLTWNLRTWKFQYGIPVKWSQYSVIYPEYFNYNQQSMGYHRLLYNKTSSSNENINYTTKVYNSSSLYSSGASQAALQHISYLNQIHDYAAADVPAMKTEPYLTSLENFTTKIKFELASTNFIGVGGKMTNYTNTWLDIAKQMDKDDSFGEQLNSTGFLSDVVDEVTKGSKDDARKLSLIYSHVQSTMKWNGFKSIFTDKTLKKAYADKTGNSAVINLLLVAMLNKAGISAAPVILSTRENGILPIAQPSISSCNYVVARAVIDDKPILLDATEPELQMGCVPFRCLNGDGHLIYKENEEKVTVVNPKSTEIIGVEAELKDGRMVGKITKSESGLNALDFRKSVKDAGGKKELFDKVKNSSPDIDFLDFNYANLDSLNQPVRIEYKIATKEKQEGNAGIIYIDPMSVERQRNPFASKARIYPVDFGATFSKLYNFQITLPAGYTVEELPKNATFTLDNHGGQFKYEASQLDQKIVINMLLVINKTLFLPEEYAALKRFYDNVINKQTEQLVLKKKTT